MVMLDARRALKGIARLNRPFSRPSNCPRSILAPAHRPPSPLRVVLSTVLSIGGSLLVNALLVSVGTAAFSFDEGLRGFPVSGLREADRHRCRHCLCCVAGCDTG